MKKILFVLFVILVTCLNAQEDHRYVPETNPLILQKLEDWQDLKFGLLMHWGPYSQWGVVESWSICAEDEDWCRRNNENYIEYKKQYEALKYTFNPVNFNPDKWADAAKKAGMKYVVFTTKHHDGFCMFDSKFTDYKVTSKECAFGNNPRSNITKEIFDSFRKEKLWVGAYFSKPDWHSEYYWWPNFATPDRNVNYSVKRYPERWENFVKFTHNQLDELVSDYGKVDILWLDGGWVRKKSEEEIKEYINSKDFNFVRVQNQDIRMDDLVTELRKKQPELIVVDRAVYGKNQNYLTPENQVPAQTLPYPWESCIISGGGWSWTKDAKYMTGTALIHLLCDIVCKGGNLLLNIAPSPLGDWDEGAYKMLSEIEEWMKNNGECIYQTRPVFPYKSGNVCLTQTKDKKYIYAIILNKENSDAVSDIIIENIDLDTIKEITQLNTKDKYNFTYSDKILKIKYKTKKITGEPAEVLKICLK